MSLRPSQTAAYWTTEFELTEDDRELLAAYLEKRDRPATDNDLARALIEHRVQREEQRVQRELARGKLYQPKNSYATGDTLVFPLFDFATGIVVGKRAGRNPEHGEFEVLEVQFSTAPKPRFFAASLGTPHKLNQDAEAGPLLRDVDGPEVLAKQYGHEVRVGLSDALQDLAADEFVNLGPYWLLKRQLADVHIGHLNIAEALIEVQNQPLPTAQILPDLDLPHEVPPAIQAFSFDVAMSQDPRFADVGVDNREWYLRRLLPEEAITTPRRLQHHAEDYDRSAISVPLLELEWELDDEWTEGGAASVSGVRLPSVTFVLIYPHRRSGTMPLSNRTRGFFPVREGKRSLITFIDGRWGKRFPGWIIPEGRYVCGLSDWYEEHKLPVGAFITLERTENPAEVVVDFRPHRMKREWVRMVRVEKGQLMFQLQKQAIAADYDEEMVVAEAEPTAVDDLRRSLYQRNPTLQELLDELAPQLMGLSTQGTVHAKTLYSASNMVRRVAPGPIFATLSSNSRYQHLGGGIFAMAR